MAAVSLPIRDNKRINKIFRQKNKEDWRNVFFWFKMYFSGILGRERGAIALSASSLATPTLTGEIFVLIFKVKKNYAKI